MSTDTDERARRPRRVSPGYAVAALAYLGLLLVVTLGETPWRTNENELPGGVLSLAVWLDPVTWLTGNPIEFFANIVLFAILGLLIRRALPALPTAAIVAIGVATTATVEIAQIPLPRVSDPRDLIANTAGAVLGPLLRRRRRAGPRTP